MRATFAGILAAGAVLAAGCSAVEMNPAAFATVKRAVLATVSLSDGVTGASHLVGGDTKAGVQALAEEAAATVRDTLVGWGRFEVVAPPAGVAAYASAPDRDGAGRRCALGTRAVAATDAALLAALCDAAQAQGVLLVAWDWHLGGAMMDPSEGRRLINGTAIATLQLVDRTGATIWRSTAWVKLPRTQGLVDANGPGNGAMQLQQTEYGALAVDATGTRPTADGEAALVPAFGAAIPLVAKEFVDQAEAALPK
jgi:hypothetical protein